MNMGPMMPWSVSEARCRDPRRSANAPAPAPLASWHPPPPHQPPAAGPVAEQLNRVAGKLADMRQSLEDLFFKDLSQAGSPEATIKGLQLELEKMQWRHQRDGRGQAQRKDLVMMEMRNGMEQDKQRTRRTAGSRRRSRGRRRLLSTEEAVVRHRKEGRPSLLLLNTSYCDYPCRSTSGLSTLHLRSERGRWSMDAGDPEPEAAMAPQLPSALHHRRLQPSCPEEVWGREAEVRGRALAEVGSRTRIPSSGWHEVQHAASPPWQLNLPYSCEAS